MIKFSVLMGVYYKEKAEFLAKSLESIYFDQELKPDEIVLVEDGPLTDELYKVIDEYKNKLGKKFKVLKLEKNMGVGHAMIDGVLNCSYDYIARMDSDDISYPNRFKEQIGFLEKNPDIDALGSYMSEFVENIDNIICVKDCPLDNFEKYIKHRSPINQPTVILKKKSVIDSGNYQEIFLNEDIYLWARMLAKGYKFANLPKELVYFRTTEDTYRRRGGLKYIKAEYKIQKKLLELKLINRLEFTFNILSKSVVRILPNSLRKIIYLKLLRKKVCKR